MSPAAQSLSLKPDFFKRLYAWYIVSITRSPSCFFAIFRGLDFFVDLFADFFGALAINHPNRSTLNLSAKGENASIKVCGVVRVTGVATKDYDRATNAHFQSDKPRRTRAVLGMVEIWSGAISDIVKLPG